MFVVVVFGFFEEFGLKTAVLSGGGLFSFFFFFFQFVCFAMKERDGLAYHHSVFIQLLPNSSHSLTAPAPLRCFAPRPVLLHHCL